MKKYLRVEMEDGSKWDIPALIIADNRAKYYAEHDFKEKDNTLTKEDLYDQSLEEALDDDYLIVDWASNNMDWSDVLPYAVRISLKEINFQKSWLNGDKEVIQK